LPAPDTNVASASNRPRRLGSWGEAADQRLRRDQLLRNLLQLLDR